MDRNLNRRQLLKVAGSGAAGIVISGCLSKLGQQNLSSGSAKKPNLIYVLADQLRYFSVGYAGDKKAFMPNIDRLASQSVSFCNAVSTMPVCSAYRASLFTGKYPTTTGMVINEMRMNPNHRCIGHVLTDAGYNTGYIGKWHLYGNDPTKQDDIKNCFVPPGPYRLGFNGYWAAYNYHHHYFEGYYVKNSPEKTSFAKGVYEPDGQTDLAADFIKKAAKTDKPFALFLSYGTPHDPWRDNNVPEKYGAMFKDAKFPRPPNYNDENDKYADKWGRLSPKQRQELEHWQQVYYAMTANLDWNIGRLLEAVNKAGLSNNTIIVFTSDHGEMFGAHGRRAKNIFYDEAARIPFLIKWPGYVPAGSVSDACLGTVDIMPTILSLMGLDVPKEVEGTSLGDCALGKKCDGPQAAFLQNTGACAEWEDGHEWRALRDKRYTYAIFRVDKTELLFDNIADPYQMRNLIAEPEHKDAAEHFRELLKEKTAALNDTFEQCTWYRDHWTKNRIILCGAKG